MFRTWLASHAFVFREGGRKYDSRKKASVGGYCPVGGTQIEHSDDTKISRLCWVDYYKACLQYLPRLKELFYEFSQLIVVTGYLIEQKKKQFKTKDLGVLSRDPSDPCSKSRNCIKKAKERCTSIWRVAEVRVWSLRAWIFYAFFSQLHAQVATARILLLPSIYFVIPGSTKWNSYIHDFKNHRPRTRRLHYKNEGDFST